MMPQRFAAFAGAAAKKQRGGLGALRSTSTKASYDTLAKLLREVSALGEIEGVLSYDEQVFMSAGSADSRATQKSVLAGILHSKKTGTEMRLAVEECRGLELSEELCEAQRANIRDAVQEFDRQARKPAEMAEAEARLESEAFVAWKGAREAADFAAFAPKLVEMVDLKRLVSRTTRPDLEEYDGALDAFERGMTSDRLDSIFKEAREGLRPILAAVLKAEKTKIHPSLVGGEESQWASTVEAQADLSKHIAEILGFDFERGRLDVSTHPFTGGAGPTDTRITTRYSSDWLQGFSGTVHEVGHALYEQGRGDAEAYRGLPVSSALSMGVHESQSLLWERMVLQSRPFWAFATPLFHERFPHTRDATAEDFYRAFNVVEPGCIRVEADELSYPFHIFLRYDVERRLFNGSLKVADIPKVWHDQMLAELGVEVPDDAQGCLQDIHWSFGALGYFPSYTLGAIMAAQIFNVAKDKIPDLDDQIARGEFKPLREWLRKNLHSVGSLHASPDALLKTVTGGKPIDVQPYLSYLKTKYSDLYQLDEF